MPTRSSLLEKIVHLINKLHIDGHSDLSSGTLTSSSALRRILVMLNERLGQEIFYREAAEGALQYDKIDSLANLIVEHGVPCIIAAANDGDPDLFYINGGASGKGVMAVASFENIEAPRISYHSSYTIDGGRKIDFLYTPGADVQWGVSMPLYAASPDYHPLLANTPGLKKYPVLLRRGTCSYDDKLCNLVAKGAQYVMLYNDETDMVTMIPDDPIVV
ncbi:hypothetical protein E4U59_003988 [Claviceps monticola]|nr:hypothetical protein E4U59_003988 [Claviceps monticola]